MFPGKSTLNLHLADFRCPSAGKACAFGISEDPTLETFAPADYHMRAMADVTFILSQIEQGDLHAAERLLPLVYEELRKLAAQKLAQEKPGQTLQATALVHEAYVRLLGDGRSEQNWDSRGHFFAAAAEAMRRILVDGARAKASAKRGGQFRRIELPEVVHPASAQAVDLLDLDEALKQLEREHPDQAAIVKLRFFAGLSLEETAIAAGVSRATAERRWAYARAWLFGKLYPE